MKTFLVLLCALGIAPISQAAQIVADAQLSYQPDGSVFDYTLTLNNLGNSTSPIETYYFGWDGPGGPNLLPSSPINVSSLTGWTVQIPHGANDGYGVLLETTMTPLNPNSSFSFTFQSPDSPAALEAISLFDARADALASWAFSGPGILGIAGEIVVDAIPEPSSLLLTGAGVLTLCALRKRKRA